MQRQGERDSNSSPHWLLLACWALQNYLQCWLSFLLQEKQRVIYLDFMNYSAPGWKATLHDMFEQIAAIKLQRITRGGSI